MDTGAERLLKERALEATAEGVVISACRDSEMPIIYVNRAFTMMTGYDAEEVLGQNCRFLQGADSDPTVKQEIRDAIRQDRPCSVEILNYRKDGTSFWNRLSITPVRNDAGRVTHFIGIQNDVTRRREAEESLRSVNAQLKRDLAAAAAVQQTQLPQRLPAIEGFTFAWRYRPCEELAGDSLNVVQLDERRVVLYIFDVSGHGVRSALQSFAVGQDLRPRVGGPDLGDPLDMLRRLNLKYPMDNQAGMFFTILYGVLDTETKTFTYASAGHPGPVLLRDGAPMLLETRGGLPVGVDLEPAYETDSVDLTVGDKLMLYTDGVVEAMSSRDIPFGQERFLKALKKNHAQAIEPLLDSVMGALENWACHVDLRDDLSVVGLSIDG
jgi:PAS domain S-box-containing protein